MLGFEQKLVSLILVVTFLSAASFAQVPGQVADPSAQGDAATQAAPVTPEVPEASKPIDEQIADLEAEISTDKQLVEGAKASLGDYKRFQKTGYVFMSASTLSFLLSFTRWAKSSRIGIGLTSLVFFFLSGGSVFVSKKAVRDTQAQIDDAQALIQIDETKLKHLQTAKAAGQK